jgi:hypothetical protein
MVEQLGAGPEGVLRQERRSIPSDLAPPGHSSEADVTECSRVTTYSLSRMIVLPDMAFFVGWMSEPCSSHMLRGNAERVGGSWRIRRLEFYNAVVAPPGCSAEHPGGRPGLPGDTYFMIGR